MTYDELDELDYFHLTDDTALPAPNRLANGPDLNWIGVPGSGTAFEIECRT